MKITVKIKEKESKIDVEDNTDIDRLLEGLGINRETVVVRKNKEICTEDETVRPNDCIEIIRITSGG